MKLIDEVKKLRDECRKEEEYYNERFSLWMRYKGESWPDLPSDSSACQSVGAIRAKLDRIISDYSEEHKEPILDDAEKRYLSAVIKPFRDRAVFVKKVYHAGSYEQIIMRVKSIATDTDFADIPFPFFNEGQMYKGMKLNKEYTLEELGL